MKSSSFAVALLVLAGANATAQKVKYKDLFVLLNAKKYVEAEPFLKRFLSDPKNADHANGNFQMGLIYQFRAEENDILDETAQYKVNIDSALYFYDRSKTLITEREVKKNDQYYQAYNRRDLRTGKFGVKLSDVHLDIEQRVEDLGGRVDKVSRLKDYFSATKTHYSSADSLFSLLQSEYENEKDVLLKADEEKQQLVKNIKSHFDSTSANFNRYKTVLSSIENAGYNQEIDLREVENFKSDGRTSPEWKESRVVLWNFGGWSGRVSNIIDTEINPLKASLSAHDKEFDNLKEQITTDSITSEESIDALSAKVTPAAIQKYDPDPLPFSVFNLKARELRYLVHKNRLAKDGLLDSLNVPMQIQITNDLIADVNGAQFLANALLTRNMAAEYEKYPKFIMDNYDGTGGFQRFVSQMTLNLQNEKAQLEEELQSWETRNNFAVYQTDSIPISASADFKPSEGNSYFTLIASDSVVNDQILLNGIVYSSDSLKGYIATVGVSRLADPIVFTNLSLPVDDASIGSIKSFMEPIAEKAFVVVFYSDVQQGESYKGVISKMSLENGLIWTTDVDLADIPYKTVYNAELSTLEVHLAPEAAELEGSGEEPKILYVDAEGNVRSE